MIFNLESKKDSLLEEAYHGFMKELNDFFEINWIRNTPKIFIIRDRITINHLLGRETEDWMVGWVNGNSVYLLNREHYEDESCHKYNEKEYLAFFKHELVHLFSSIFCNIKDFKPIWLNEGLSIYLSGQNKFKKRPSFFKEFLSFYENEGKDVYHESGFAVEILINKFGKERFFSLLKKLKEIKDKEEFEIIFKEIYGFNLDYDNFNKYLNF